MLDSLLNALLQMKRLLEKELARKIDMGFEHSEFFERFKKGELGAVQSHLLGQEKPKKL